MTDQHVMSLRQAAQRLGVSYSTAIRWANDGSFPGLIKASGFKRRHWLVSVPKFNQEVHGGRDTPVRDLNLGERREDSLQTSLPPAAEVQA